MSANFKLVLPEDSDVEIEDEPFTSASSTNPNKKVKLCKTFSEVYRDEEVARQNPPCAPAVKVRATPHCNLTKSEDAAKVRELRSRQQRSGTYKPKPNKKIEYCDDPIADCGEGAPSKPHDWSAYAAPRDTLEATGKDEEVMRKRFQAWLRTSVPLPKK